MQLVIVYNRLRIVFISCPSNRTLNGALCQGWQPKWHVKERFCRAACNWQLYKLYNFKTDLFLRIVTIVWILPIHVRRKIPTNPQVLVDYTPYFCCPPPHTLLERYFLVIWWSYIFFTKDQTSVCSFFSISSTNPYESLEGSNKEN